MKMHEIKHLRWFVTGALTEYFKNTNMKVDVPEFDKYVDSTVDKCIRYIKGTQVADASFSDIQCIIAEQARSLFGVGSEFRY